jgi:hypothetical protein
MAMPPLYLAAAARPHAAPAHAYARTVPSRPARTDSQTASVVSAAIGTSVRMKRDSRTWIGRTAICAAASSATRRDDSSQPRR